MACVRCRTRCSRVFNTIAAACWLADLIGTKRIVLRMTASQIASASAASVSALYKPLYVGRRNQAHIVTKPSDLASPIM